MSSSVHVKEAVLIAPSEPTPNHILHLSALDSQPFVRFTFEFLLVYEPRSEGPDRAQTTRNIKTALGRALVPYYPLAGRVRNRIDGAGLEVLCRAQGAVFIEAASDSAVSEFESVPKRTAQWRKFLSVHAADVLKGAPPLVMQLTWLADGGATLAVGFNHCVCDGIGAAEFLNSFAELAAGKRELGELEPKPVWNRYLLDRKRIGLTNSDPMSHPEFRNVPDICGFTSRFVSEKLTPTSTNFDNSRLNELKKLAKSTYSSFEVLSGHVWRSWVRALNLPPAQIVKLIFSVNIRHRVRPSLPSGYYGNAFVLGCAQTTAGELQGKGLPYAAELVKRAKDRVGNEYVGEVAEAVSGGASADSVGVLILTQWSRMGLQSVDFGLGRPVHVGPVCCDKYCVLLPVNGEIGALKVNLAVPSSAVEHYLCLLRNVCD